MSNKRNKKNVTILKMFINWLYILGIYAILVSCGAIALLIVLLLRHQKQCGNHDHTCPKLQTEFQLDRLVLYGKLGGKPCDEALLVDYADSVPNYVDFDLGTETLTDFGAQFFYGRAEEVFKLDDDGNKIDHDDNKFGIIFLAASGDTFNPYQKPLMQDLIQQGHHFISLAPNSNDVWNWFDNNNNIGDLVFDVNCADPDSLCISTTAGVEDVTLILSAALRLNKNFVIVGYSTGAQMVSSMVSYILTFDQQNVYKPYFQGAVLINGGSQWCYMSDPTLSNVTNGKKYFSTCSRPILGSSTYNCCPLSHAFNVPSFANVPPLLFLQTFNDSWADWDAGRNLFNAALAKGVPDLAICMDGGDHHGITENQRPVLFKFLKWLESNIA